MRDIAYMGCVACMLENREGVPAQVHHVIDGNRRKGHMYTIALCPWHHVGEQPGVDAKWGLRRIGPSVHKQKKEFEARYGSQDSLVRLTTELIESMETGWLVGQYQILSAYRDSTLYSQEDATCQDE